MYKLHADPYKKTASLSKREFGIWAVEKSPQGQVKLYARCDKCVMINDMTGGFFASFFENGKCTQGVSGCAACKFCGNTFYGQRFSRWKFEYGLSYHGENFFSANVKRLQKVFREYKAGFYVYAVRNAVSMARYEDYLAVMSTFLTGPMIHVIRKADDHFVLGGSYKGVSELKTMEKAVEAATDYMLSKAEKIR